MGKESNLSVLWSFKVISQGAISAPMFSLKGPSMVKAAYPTAFPLKHQQKVATIRLSMHSAVTNSLHMAWSDPDWLPDYNQTNKSWQDLRLALALAESVSQSIPTVAAANELYKAAKSLGLADHDFSAVIEALKAKVQSSQQQ